MNPKIGWALALAALAAGWLTLQWQGAALAFSVIVFWLLLQFSRVMRVLRLAKESPVGQVGSAVMLHSRLRQGMKLLDVIQLTHSLGTKLSDEPETWAWSDAGGVRVEAVFEQGLCQRWTLQRPDEPAAETQA